MKIFIRYPQNLYFQEFDIFAVSTQVTSTFSPAVIRDTETGEETKFLCANWYYFFPYDLDFLKTHLFPFYLTSGDGSYSCQLKRYVAADGFMPEFPFRGIDQKRVTFLQTTDEKYIVWMAAFELPENNAYTQLLSYNGLHFFQVITKTEDFKKEINFETTDFDFWYRNINNTYLTYIKNGSTSSTDYFTISQNYNSSNNH